MKKENSELDKVIKEKTFKPGEEQKRVTDEGDV